MPSLLHRQGVVQSDRLLARAGTGPCGASGKGEQTYPFDQQPADAGGGQGQTAQPKDARKVFFAPVKPQPDGKYMRQIVRILTDSEDGFLDGKRYLIHDRDPLYRTAGFHETLRSSGIEPVKLPARSPDLNCHAERFVKSVKSECLDHLILSSVKQLEYVLEQYSEYYHHERIHQGVGQIIEPKHPIDETADIVCIEHLGGLLKSYHRLAA